MNSGPLPIGFWNVGGQTSCCRRVLVAQCGARHDGVHLAGLGWDLSDVGQHPQGMGFARSPEVVHSKLMETLVWMRIPDDVVFATGTIFLTLFALRLLTHAKRSPPKQMPLIPGVRTGD